MLKKIYVDGVVLFLVRKDTVAKLHGVTYSYKPAAPSTSNMSKILGVFWKVGRQ